MSAYVQRRMFTVKDYHRMADAGILTEDDRVELIEGEIVEMAPIGGPHAGVVNRLNKLFNERLRDRTVVSIQNPVKMSEFNEPQPDVALLVPRKDFYGSALPRREDAQLIVEVADTSLARDLEVKVPLYSSFGVQELWIVDTRSHKLHVCRRPGIRGYDDVRELGAGD